MKVSNVRATLEKHRYKVGSQYGLALAPGDEQTALEFSSLDGEATLVISYNRSTQQVSSLGIYYVEPGPQLGRHTVCLEATRISFEDDESFTVKVRRAAISPDDRKVAAPNVPASAGVAETGAYRNLFVESGRLPEEVGAKVEAAFQQLFHGDPDSEAVYFSDGGNANGPAAYICDVGHNDVRSEGMSYGMMIAVQLDKQAEFDALWNWSKSRMYHDDPAHPAYGFFSWSVGRDGTPNDEMPAADGEEYFATALYFADARWGSRAGIYDYAAQADRLLRDMRHRKKITGPTNFGDRKMMTAGELFHPKHAMVRFTPDHANRDHTDPSYHLPAFYEYWARRGPETDREFWKQAATASREFFEKAAHPKTGLTPEYAEFDGRPWLAPWHPDSVHFVADSWRTAMNWAVDWAWWGADPRACERSRKIQKFFEGREIKRYGSRYTLDGKSMGGEHSTGLVAMNATASLAADDERGKAFIDALWNTPVPTGQWRYYDGMLYMLGLLNCAGEFRAWGL